MLLKYKEKSLWLLKEPVFHSRSCSEIVVSNQSRGYKMIRECVALSASSDLEADEYACLKANLNK